MELVLISEVKKQDYCSFILRVSEFYERNFQLFRLLAFSFHSYYPL